MNDATDSNKNVYPIKHDLELEKKFLQNHILECQSKIVKIDETLETVDNIKRSKLPLWDAEKIAWLKTTGAKGDFLIATVKDNPNNENLELLREDLKLHDGKLTYQSYFYWLFTTDNISVGRKQRDKRI